MAKKRGIIARVIGAISRMLLGGKRKHAKRGKAAVAKIPSVKASPKERKATIAEAKKAAKGRKKRTKAIGAKAGKKPAAIGKNRGSAAVAKPVRKTVKKKPRAARKVKKAPAEPKGGVPKGAGPRGANAGAGISSAGEAGESTSQIQRRIVEQQAKTTESLAEIANAIKELAKKRAEKEPYPERYGFIRKANALEGEIGVVRRLMKSLEVEFLKRRVDRDKFQAKMLEYQQKLRELSERKKLASSGKATLEPLPDAPETTIERILGSDKLEGIEQDRIDRIDSKLNTIMNKYHVPESEVAERARGVNQGTVIESFSKLIGMIEREEKKKMGPEIKAAPIETVAPKEVIREMARVNPVMKDVGSHRIVTDFDRVLEAVNNKGKASTGELAKAVKADKKRIEEVVKILEENGLVEVKYSAIGGARVFSKQIGAGKGGGKNG